MDRSLSQRRERPRRNHRMFTSSSVPRWHNLAPLRPPPPSRSSPMAIDTFFVFIGTYDATDDAIADYEVIKD
ncbi:MAG TPA: hypothetical protein VNC41_00460, partial [Acidimicrobiia bacterium]|nr:hypothetical protein [Acidimicrobiia bacterium]